MTETIESLVAAARELPPPAPTRERRRPGGIWGSEYDDYARMSEELRARTTHYLDLRYGPDPRHIVDVYVPEGLTAPAPVLVYFHGGALEEGHPRNYAFVGAPYLARGAIFVSVGYRLLPRELAEDRDAVERRLGMPVHSVQGDDDPEVVDIRRRVAEVGRDAALDARSAIAWIHRHIAAFGGDPDRIAVAGHSAGAMLCVVTACDRTWQAELGAPEDAVKAMIPVGGRYGLWLAGAVITGARLDDPPHEWRLSAFPRSVIVFGEEEYDGTGEDDSARAHHVAEINRTLIAALREGGADVTELALSPRGHWQTLRSLADEDDRTVPAVLAAMGMS